MVKCTPNLTKTFCMAKYTLALPTHPDKVAKSLVNIIITYRGASLMPFCRLFSSGMSSRWVPNFYADLPDTTLATSESFLSSLFILVVCAAFVDPVMLLGFQVCIICNFLSVKHIQMDLPFDYLSAGSA